MATKKAAPKKKAVPAKKALAKKPARTKAQKPPGRPSDFAQKVADAICERLAAGESLRTICLSESMPARSTVFKWLTERTEFSDQYARAREVQADALFDEILGIADDSALDFGIGQNGSEVVNNEAIARSRLRVDARKWMAGKLRPKVYGEKLAVGGADDLPPIQTESTVTLSPDEAYLRMIGK